VSEQLSGAELLAARLNYDNWQGEFLYMVNTASGSEMACMKLPKYFFPVFIALRFGVAGPTSQCRCVIEETCSTISPHLRDQTGKDLRGPNVFSHGIKLFHCKLIACTEITSLFLLVQEDHRIIECFRLEGAFKGHLVQPTRHEQGHLQPDHQMLRCLNRAQLCSHWQSTFSLEINRSVSIRSFHW